jgi:uncharacterized protein YdaU (DUF1376 family)
MSAKHLAQRVGNCKSGEFPKTPFLMFYTDDYLTGTQHMPPDQQGFYFRCLCLMWDRKGGIPDDNGLWLARMCSWHISKVRKLRAALLETGKLKSIDGFLVNSRMMRDIAAWLAGADKKPRQPKPAAAPELPVAAMADDLQAAFDFDAEPAALQSAPKSTPGLTPELTPESTPETIANSPMKSVEASPLSIFQTPEHHHRGGGAHEVVAATPADDAPDPAAVITTDQLVAFRDLCDTFGQPGVMVLRPTTQEEASGLLLGTVRAMLCGRDLRIAEQVIPVVLAKVHAAGTQRGGRGITSLASYLTKVLRSEVADIEVAGAAAVAKARTEEAVQMAVARKRLDAVAKGGSGPACGLKRRMTEDELWAEVDVRRAERASAGGW